MVQALGVRFKHMSVLCFGSAARVPDSGWTSAQMTEH